MDNLRANQRIANTHDYSIKAMLLGFIPIKIKDVLFRFEKINHQIYLNQVDTESRTGEYLAVKTEKIPLPTAWASRLGHYKITNPYKSNAPEFDFSNATVRFFEEDGWGILNIKTAGMDFTYYLNIVNDTLAVTGGIGRQAGNTIRILDNGQLYFSGFELTKIN